MEVDKSKVSERIEAIMQKLKLNQKQLAKALGVTQPAISMYLNERIPPAQVLLKLAQLSDRSVEWFLTGDLDDMIYKVSEPSAKYDGRLKLEKKISLLPDDLYEHLETLVDSILDNIQK
jgi:transcriptional regulator with XRE-family HTH domain